VTTQVTDAVTIVHGPGGCTHHNFSLLHATLQGNDSPRIPRLLSSSLDELGVIFGGEESLERAIRDARREDPGAIFVLSTCVVATIGDDVESVCRRGWGIPVIPIPGGGFLGGAFHEGMQNALIALTSLAPPATGTREGIAIVGERNLEYEVEENYAEMQRILRLLGLEPGIRFIRNITTEGIPRLGSCAAALLRDDALAGVSAHLQQHFSLPCISPFPQGSDTSGFIRRLGEITGVPVDSALAEERRRREEMLQEFADLRGTAIALPCRSPWAYALGESLGLRITPAGTAVPCPADPPVGLMGTARLLHRWRRVLHA
jgi:nitrogenase molybdenum-iron protein alpha/beta subunit